MLRAWPCFRRVPTRSAYQSTSPGLSAGRTCLALADGASVCAPLSIYPLPQCCSDPGAGSSPHTHGDPSHTSHPAQPGPSGVLPNQAYPRPPVSIRPGHRAGDEGVHRAQAAHNVSARPSGADRPRLSCKSEEPRRRSKGDGPHEGGRPVKVQLARLGCVDSLARTSPAATGLLCRGSACRCPPSIRSDCQARLNQVLGGRAQKSSRPAGQKKRSRPASQIRRRASAMPVRVRRGQRCRVSAARRRVRARRLGIGLSAHLTALSMADTAWSS